MNASQQTPSRSRHLRRVHFELSNAFVHTTSGTNALCQTQQRLDTTATQLAAHLQQHTVEVGGSDINAMGISYVISCYKTQNHRQSPWIPALTEIGLLEIYESTKKLLCLHCRLLPELILPSLIRQRYKWSSKISYRR